MDITARKKNKLTKKTPVRKKIIKTSRVSRSVGGNVTIFLFLLLVGAFMVLPVIYTLVMSLKPLNEIFIYPPRFFVRNPTTDNFVNMFQLTQDMWVPFERYLFNSVFVSLVGTTAYVFIASMAGYPLAKNKSKWIGIYYQIVVVAILFRSEVTMIPQYLIISKIGLLDNILSLILPTLAGSFGVFLMRQNMVAIPDTIIESAKIDGANDFRIFFTMVMPMCKPAWLTLIIFTFQQLWATDSSRFIYNESLKTLNNVLQQLSSAGISRAGVGAAVAVILMVPPVAVFIFSQSSVMETMSRSGMKD